MGIPWESRSRGLTGFPETIPLKSQGNSGILYRELPALKGEQYAYGSKDRG